MRARELRARARSEQHSCEKRGLSPSEEKIIQNTINFRGRPFSSPRPNLSTFFASNLHKFNFSLASRRAEQRWTTAGGLVYFIPIPGAMLRGRRSTF